MNQSVSEAESEQCWPVNDHNKVWSQYLSTACSTAHVSMDTATCDAALWDSFLSGCVINAVNINVLCLSIMHRGVSVELPLVTNHTAMHYWAVTLANAEFCPRSERNPKYFLWCWLAFTAWSPETASTKSHSCRWQLFSLFDPQEVFSPWISPWIAMATCLHRAGTAKCLHARTNGSRQAICYVPPAKKELKKMIFTIWISGNNTGETLSTGSLQKDPNTLQHNNAYYKPHDYLCKIWKGKKIIM